MAYPLQSAASELVGAVTLAVSTTGNDTDATRPKRIVRGDWSAKPFLTIQAAIDSLPRGLRKPVAINIGAGSFAGFDALGFQSGDYPRITNFVITGSRATFVPTTGPSSGMATSGSNRTLVLTGAGWTVDNLVGKFVKVTAGTGSGLILLIAKNTSDTITFAGGASPAIDGTSQFTLEDIVTVLTSDGPNGTGRIHGEGGNIYLFVNDIKCTGVTGFGIGVYATRIHTLGLRRVVVEGSGGGNSSFGILATSLHYISLSNCAAIGVGTGVEGQAASFWYSITGVLVKGCVWGWWIDGVVLISGSACYFRDCTSYGIYVESAFDIRVYSTPNLIIDNCGTGIRSKGGKLRLANASISNCATRTFDIEFVTLYLQTGLTGTGNGGHGLNAFGVGNVVKVEGFIPTISGASGDATVDGTTVLVWATDFNASGDYAHDPVSGAHIYRS